MSEEIIDGSPLQESAEYVREKAGNYCGTSPKGINDRQVLLTSHCGISGKMSPKWGAWAVWKVGSKAGCTAVAAQDGPIVCLAHWMK